jgi:hypothetical protein
VVDVVEVEVVDVVEVEVVDVVEVEVVDVVEVEVVEVVEVEVVEVEVTPQLLNVMLVPNSASTARIPPTSSPGLQ